MKVNVYTHKVTADEDHPAPWRWWFSVDTPFGNRTDEGLAATEEKALEDAGSYLRDWMLAQVVARSTKKMTTIEVDDIGDGD